MVDSSDLPELLRVETGSDFNSGIKDARNATIRSHGTEKFLEKRESFSNLIALFSSTRPTELERHGRQRGKEKSRAAAKRGNLPAAFLNAKRGPVAANPKVNLSFFIKKKMSTV